MKKIFLTLVVVAFAMTAGCGSDGANNDATQTGDATQDGAVEQQPEGGAVNQPVDGANQ